MGYGGTKKEMERLLEDAEKISGMKFDISNLSDVYTAIHIMQEQMGIAGTTAQEAADTISGSLNQLKGAWTNLVAGFANKDADLGKLVNDVVQSAETAFGNLLPAVETAIKGVISTVEGIAPIITDRLPTIVDQIVPPLLEAATSIVNALVNALPDTLQAIVDIAPQVITDIISTISDLLPQIIDVGIKAIVSLANGMSETLPELIPIAVDAILNIVDTLINNIDLVVDAAIKIVMALADGLVKALPKLIEKAPELIIKLGTALVDNVGKLADVPPKIIKAISDGLVHTDWTETAQAMMDGLVNALDTANKKVQLWIDNTFNEGKLYGGDISNVRTNEFVQNLDENKDVVVNAVSEFTNDIQKSYDDYYGIAEKNNRKVEGYTEEAIGKMADAQRMSVENAGRTTQDAIDEILKKRGTANKAVNDTVEEVELSEKEMEQALKNRFRDLEAQMLENGFSEEWLLQQERAYIEALDHSTDLYKDYNLKLLKVEEKLNKQRESERQKQQKEEQKRQQEAEKQVKYNLEKKFQELETYAVANNMTEEWLVKQERMYLETLDKNTDLYKDYNLKLLKAERKVNEDIQKERQKQAEDTQKTFKSMVEKMIKDAKDKISEYEKALEKIKDQIKSFGESLQGSFKEMFKFDVDEETGKVTAVKTKNYINNLKKDLKEYYENIQLLKDMNLSDTLMEQFKGLSTQEGLALSEYFLSLSAPQLKTLSANWEEAGMWGQKVSGAVYEDELETAQQELDTTRNTLLGEINTTIKNNGSELLKALSTLGNYNIEINGIQYQSLGELTEAISTELGFTTSRRGAGYAV